MINKESNKKIAWRFYDSWRRAKTFSPALKCRVRVSATGWNHIVGQSKFKKRSKQEVARRLVLLPLAQELITISTTIQDREERNGFIYYALEALFLEFNCKLRVIIREDRQGNKIFYSVMNVPSRNK